jgi:hypothetical protein
VLLAGEVVHGCTVNGPKDGIHGHLINKHKKAPTIAGAEGVLTTEGITTA